MKSAITNKDGEIDLKPLYMSLIAGMSTCLGAVWVLFQRRTPSSTPTKSTMQQQQPVIRPSTMCFSLALAGSVMITVSVVSIIPECLREDQGEGEEFDGQEEEEEEGEYRMIPLLSMKFLYRLFFHIIGYVLYFLLAKFAFPEPDEILGLSSSTDGGISSSSNHKSNNNNNNANDDNNNNIVVELTQELLISEKRTNNNNNNNNNNHNNPSDNENDSQLSSPQQRNNNQQARNRRLNSSTSNNACLLLADEENTNNTNNKNSSIDSSSNNRNNKENKKPEHFFRTLSRYSSGADLESNESKRAWRVAMLLFLSLSVHNFPEGLAVAASTMESPKLGLKVTIGIMVHNIPEGVSIAVPCIAARPDSPWLAFWLSALSGLAEPFGAFVALFVLRKFDTTTTNTNTNPQQQSATTEEPEIFNMENVLAFVAGIMIMVAVAELFPEALRHTKDGKTPFVVGTLAGIVLMLATELYLA